MLNFLNRRPQELCKQCGRCCRVSVTSISYEELKTRAENGDKYAIEFLDIFVPYESIEKAKEVDKELVENILQYATPDKFYGCKYITPENTCPRYETRYELCRQFPGSPWAIVPPGCGFEPWLKLEGKNTIEHIKNLKNDKIKYQNMIDSSDDEQLKQKLKSAINSIDKIVDIYKDYGSENW